MKKKTRTAKPAAKPKRKRLAAEPKRKRLAAEPKKVVLLVDDDPDWRLLVRDALAQSELAASVPIEIHDVPDGEAALQYLFADGDATRPLPALIYLDCEMPRLDGVTLLTIIRRDPRLRAIPTVMLTGVADEAEMRRATDYGASAYIVKPADASELVRVIAASAAHWLRSYGKQAA